MRTSFGQEGKGGYGSCRSWINVWVCRKNCDIPWQSVPYVSASSKGAISSVCFPYCTVAFGVNRLERIQVVRRCPWRGSTNASKLVKSSPANNTLWNITTLCCQMLSNLCERVVGFLCFFVFVFCNVLSTVLLKRLPLQENHPLTSPLFAQLTVAVTIILMTVFNPNSSTNC